MGWTCQHFPMAPQGESSHCFNDSFTLTQQSSVDFPLDLHKALAAPRPKWKPCQSCVSSEDSAENITYGARRRGGNYCDIMPKINEGRVKTGLLLLLFLHAVKSTLECYLFVLSFPILSTPYYWFNCLMIMMFLLYFMIFYDICKPPRVDAV